MAIAVAREREIRRATTLDSARQSVNKVHDRRERDGRPASALTGQRHGTLTFHQCRGAIFPRSFSILGRPEIVDPRESYRRFRPARLCQIIIDRSRLKSIASTSRRETCSFREFFSCDLSSVGSDKCRSKKFSRQKTPCDSTNLLTFAMRYQS